MIDSIRHIRADKLKPYANNPVKHPEDQIEKVANSIRGFGWTQPIVIDKHNIIVAGHARWMAQMSIDPAAKVPIVKAESLTDQQIKAYRIIDNQVGNARATNTKILASEIKAIDCQELTAFDEMEIISLYAASEPAAQEPKEKEPTTESDPIITIKFRDGKQYDDFLWAVKAIREGRPGISDYEIICEACTHES